MLKSLLLPVETSGLYFQDYSVLNAERLYISFAGKPIWGSSKTEKLKGFPNKCALQKKKAPNPAQEPKSKQPTWEKGSTLEPGGAVLLSELRMEQRLQLAVMGNNICTCSLPLLGSPQTQLHRGEMQIYARV